MTTHKFCERFHSQPRMLPLPVDKAKSRQHRHSRAGFGRRPARRRRATDVLNRHAGASGTTESPGRSSEVVVRRTPGVHSDSADSLRGRRIPRRRRLDSVSVLGEFREAEPTTATTLQPNEYRVQVTDAGRAALRSCASTASPASVRRPCIRGRPSGSPDMPTCGPQGDGPADCRYRPRPHPPRTCARPILLRALLRRRRARRVPRRGRRPVAHGSATFIGEERGR